MLQIQGKQLGDPLGSRYPAVFGHGLTLDFYGKVLRVPMLSIG